MAKREMSEKEQAFVNSIIESKEKDKIITNNDSGNNAEHKSNTKDSNDNKRDSQLDKKVKVSHGLSKWIALFMIMPIAISVVFYYFIFKMETYFGKESLDFLRSQELGEDFYSELEKAGFGWTEPLMAVYDYRWVIIVSIFIVFFAIAALLMFIDSRRLTGSND